MGGVLRATLALLITKKTGLTMKTINKTKFAIGASIIAGLATGCSTTDSPPFAQKDLSSGYMNEAESAANKAKEGKCGEGKCGSGAAEKAKAKAVEGKCGEAKCGGAMAAPVENAKPAEGKCGEGKCGEGKCGSSK